MVFPGPRAVKYLERRRRYYATSTDSSRVIPDPDRYEGSFIFDVDGNKFLDLHCGASVATLPASMSIRKAAGYQLMRGRFTEHHSNPNPGGIDAAEFLAKLSPVKKPSKVFFSNSGTEANEAARKLCEAYRYHRGEKERRSRAIYFLNGFAGRTHGSLVATTSKPETQRNPYWDHCDEINSLYLPFPQKGKGWRVFRTLFAEEKDLFGKPLKLAEVDRLLIELPCQGEGGVLPVDEDGLRLIYEKTQKAGVIFIADVIQCGMGRTGTLFGCDIFPWLKPDIMTMGKALAGGISPVGATIFRADLDWKRGEHSNTFGGNPLAMTAALAALAETEHLIKEGVVEKLAKDLEAGLQSLAQNFPDFILEIRGLGAMWAMELINSGAKERLIEIGEEMVNETGCGLLLLGAGNVHNPNSAVRLMPPLTISEEELKLAFELLMKAFATLRKEVERSLTTSFVR